MRPYIPLVVWLKRIAMVVVEIGEAIFQPLQQLARAGFVRAIAHFPPSAIKSERCRPHF